MNSYQRRKARRREERYWKRLDDGVNRIMGHPSGTRSTPLLRQLAGDIANQIKASEERRILDSVFKQSTSPSASPG